MFNDDGDAVTAEAADAGVGVDGVAGVDGC